MVHHGGGGVDESVPLFRAFKGVFGIFEPHTLEVHPLGQRLEGEGFNQCFVVASSHQNGALEARRVRKATPLDRVGGN